MMLARDSQPSRARWLRGFTIRFGTPTTRQRGQCGSRNAQREELAAVEELGFQSM
jgi:hypothetical protein